ncbi:hypothetical protein NPIL_50911 [Nephila pilipes]|uniref:C2H2-type domain-containing protein n=1 Tax=Nephila pilipes TaxID=299642 RepID=A0A8X6PG55_NEPPI|nr:hypothetical protein NPIL_50911 [Nephila pilipes]
MFGSETSDWEILDLFLKEKFSEMRRKSPLSSDGEMSVEKENENLGTEDEDKIQCINKIKDFLMDERIPWDSTIYSPRPSTGRGITREHDNHRFARDNGTEITKSNTHNVRGNEKQRKETHAFKTSNYNVSYISKNIRGRDKVKGDKKGTFECKTCEKLFTNQGRLKRHKVVHTGERRFPCDYCGKAFRDSFGLKEHVRTHTGEKPYLCPQCPKRFSSLSSLNRHKRFHLKVRFSSSNNLKLSPPDVVPLETPPNESPPHVVLLATPPNERPPDD